MKSCIHYPDIGKHLILLAYASIFLMFHCSAQKKAENDTIDEIQKRKGIPVSVLAVKKDTFQVYELLSGTARGYYQTAVTAAIPGKIIDIRAKIGDYVEKNTSLMSIEPDHAQNYDVVKQQYENAHKSRQRIRVLAEQGGVSQELIDEINAGYMKAKEDLDAVRKSQFVLSPFSGTVVSIHQTPNSKITPGEDLVTVAQIEKIRIPLKISDKIINRFKPGQKAVAIVGEDSVNGFIENVSLAGSSSTHMFEIEAVFDNPGHLIKPAMHIPVKVITDFKKNVISLNIDNILNEGTMKYVFLANDSSARKIAIEAGKRSGDRCEIISGIDESDLVVIRGAGLLYDGAKVNIVEQVTESEKLIVNR